MTDFTGMFAGEMGSGLVGVLAWALFRRICRCRP